MTHFTWLDDDLRARVLDIMARPMPRGRETLAYRTPPRHLGQAVVDGKPHLVCVAYYPFASVIKRALALRRGGGAHVTFIGCCIREDAAIERWFDEYYEVEDYNELHSLLKNAAPTALHATAPHFHMAAIAADAAPDARFVLDIVDSALFQYNDLEHPECRLERALLARSAAVAHKMPEEAYAKLMERYGLDVPGYLAHSLPCAENFVDTPAAPAPPHRLVYAGGVMPYAIALKNGYGHHVFDPLITGTAGLGIELDFHVNQNARNMYWDEHERYFQYARELPHFRFHKGVPFHQLPQVLSTAHYGLLFDNLARTEHDPEIFRYNMSSKIFSYLEAGLPILVYRQFEYMTRFILEHGIGAVYPIERLEELPGILAGLDHAALKENVRRFRAAHEIGTTRGPLRRALGLPE
jgi:hypothetical protein